MKKLPITDYQLLITNQIGLPRRSFTQAGFMAFASLLVVSAVTLAIAVSIVLLGVGEARSSLDFRLGSTALVAARACGEEALYRVKFDQSYAGGSLNVGGGVCSISVIALGSQRSITVDAQVSAASSYSKRIRIVAERTGGGVSIKNWQEE